MKISQGSCRLLQISVFFMLSISDVYGINCFQCNSNNNSACTSLELTGTNPLYPQPCVGNYGENKPFCRKTVMKISDPKITYEPRTVRACGWIAHKNPCYTANNDDHDEKVCQCFEDGCNGAHSILANTLALLLLPGLLAAKTLFLS